MATKPKSSPMEHAKPVLTPTQSRPSVKRTGPKVTIQEETKEKAEEQPVHTVISRYILTINSQQTLEKLGDQGKKQFAFRCMNLLQQFPNLIVFTPGYPSNLDDLDFDFNYAFESGDAMHRWHLHSVIEIKHNSHIKIDFDLLNETMKQYGYHVNCRFAKNVQTSENMRKYVRKNN